MNEYTVYDGQQPVLFTGELLAQVSSDDGHKARWTVTEIYRTQGSSYIVHKIGMSRRQGERALHSAQISDTPEGAIECLRFVDPDGVTTMRWTDKRALLEAITIDEDLHAAYSKGFRVA